MKHHKAICITSIIGLLFTTSILRADEERSTVSRTIAGTTKDYLSDPARTGSLVGSIIAGSAVANPLAPVLGSVVGFVIGKSSVFSENNRNRARPGTSNNRSLMPDNASQITSVSGLSGTAPLDSMPANGVTIIGNLEAGVPIEPGISTELNGNAVPGKEIESAPTLAGAQPTISDEQSSGIQIVEQINHSQVVTPLETIVPTDLVREAEMGIHSIQTTGNGIRVESAGAANLQQQLADACSNYKTVKTASLNCYYYAQ